MKHIAIATLTVLGFVGTVSARPVSPAPKLRRVELTEAAAIPQCRGVINDEIFDVANDATVDPARTFKGKRTAAWIQCASRVWKARHHAAPPTVDREAEEARERSPRLSKAGRQAIGQYERRTDPDSIPDRDMVPYAGPPNDPRPVPAVRTRPLRDTHPLPPPHPDKNHDGHEGHPEPIRPQPPVDSAEPDFTPVQLAPGALISAPTSTGLGFDGVGVGLSGFIPSSNPPDVNGRVGATQYVQWNNTSFAIFNKTTGALQYGPAAGNTLFQALGGPCAIHNDGDPVVAYDILAGRWILSQFLVGGSPSYSHQCVAVSVTGDATGSYYLYDFVTDATNFVDYPHIGVWPDGYYMTSHVFNAAGTAQVAARVNVFERDKMLLGQPARQVAADLSKKSNRFQYGFLPADLDSLTPPPAGEASFVIGPDPAFTNRTDVARVAVTWGATPTITLTEGTVSVGIGNAPCVNNTAAQDNRDCVPQPSPAVAADDLDNISFHYMYRLGYRNFGGSPVQESLVVSALTAGSASTPSHGAVRWFEFRNAGNSTSMPTSFQAATFDPDTAYRWLPSIAMDKDHNIALGYSKSSLTVIPGIYMTGRLGTDTVNTMGAETTVQAGIGVQTAGAGNRWGDYSAMTLDPVDQCTFWYTNEYLKTNGAFNWSTRIAAYKFPSCAASAAWGTVTGTVTSCLTGVPLSGVVVSLSNGFAGATNASGVYSIPVPAGSYTVTAADADRNCATSSPASAGVSVASGGTSTQNFCMTGTSNLQFNALALSDTANGNNNGIVNSNECVSVNVTVKNNGCANETAVSATLTTTTPNVTITQGSSTYPDMVIDATGVNATPFKIQTSNSFLCGTVINLSLNLTYASGSKTVAVSVPTCAGGANQFIPASTLTTADLTQSDRLGRDGVPSTCAGKASPGGGFAGTKYYKTFTFANNGGSAACFTVAINAAAGGAGDIESAAYLNTYNPANLSQNYLGDTGITGLGTTVTNASYSFSVPAASNFVVVVNTTGTTTSSQFSGTVSGFFDFTAGPGGCPACTPPATPTITPGGPTIFCAGGSVTLTASSASGNQWYLDGNPIAGATNQTYIATASGSYTVKTTVSGCTSAPSTAVVVTVNPTPATPTITPGGPTTFCTGGSVTLTSSSASGNQWYLNGNPIASANGQSYIATAAGSYTVKVTASGCTSAPSTAVVVTVNPTPATPTITPGGPTTFCTPGSVTLTSSSASGNQWYLNGNPISGATNQSYIASATGNYTVIVTASGCPSAPSAATSVTANPTPATPTITPSGPTTFCAGGSVTLTSSSASGNQWYLNGNPISGQTNQTYIATASGSYTVIVTQSGCPSASSAATVVTVNPIPATPTITPGGPTTFCTPNSVTLTSSSASGNQWYLNGNPISGATNQQYIATATGNYTVIVTAAGCPSAPSAATSVTANPTPATPTITPGGPTTFCAPGSVTLTSSSASGNQWYLNGSPIASATGQQYIATASGSYTVDVTASGCTSAQSAATVVTVNPTPATPTITPGGPTTFCAGGSVTLSSSNASGNQWYLNGNPISGQTNQTYIATASGSYTVIVTQSGCPSAASAATVVTVNPTPATPTITPSGPTTFCTGGSVTLTSSSANGNQWLLNGSPIAGETNQTYIASASGSYTVIVTQSGCPSAPSTPTVVTVNPIPATPTITPSGPTTFCAGGSVTLTSSSASGNQWYLDGNPIASATGQQYIATATGNYTVIVTTAGCSSAPSAATSVTVNPTPATPTITPGGPTTFCEPGSVTLTSSSATGNQWYLNGNPIASATGQQYIATASGSYTVDVTASGCTSAQSAATVVTVNPTPATPTITPGGPTTFCAGGSVTLTSSSAFGNQWYLDGNPIGAATGQQYIATASGSYTVIVTQSGCPSAASAATVVTVNPTPATPTITPSGPTTFCAGGSVTLSSSSATGNQWYLDGNPIAGETNQTYIASASGSYTVIVTQSGCPSAPSTATVVTVNPTPATPTITPSGPTTFCAGGSVTLTSSSATGNQWLLNGNPIGGETNQTYIATASGSYTVVVTQSGCPSAASAATVVTVNPTPATPTITPSGPTTFCAGGSVTLTSSSATGNQWYLDGNPIGAATGQQYIATASGSYTVVVTQSGCPSAPSAATVVTVNPTPATPTITPSGPTTFCAGGSVTLSSSSASGNQWYLDGNPIAGETNQTYIANASGSYTVVVTQSGCPSAPSAATVVTVNPTPATPTITPSGPTTFCAGGSVTLTSSSATGNQWLLNGSPIAGETNQTYIASASGSYTVIVTQSGCPSAASAATVVTVNPTPATPTITPSGPTTFCAGGSVTLTSSSATGNQWLLNGNPIAGETNQTYIASASGSYTVIVTQSGCPSASSAATVVTVNPTPATPTITPSGPTTFCAGGSVTLTSSSASGNQWYLDGNPIGAATGQQYIATASGSYTVIVTQSGCPSASSAATVVTVNPTPATPTITPSGPTTFCAGASVTLTSSSVTGNQWLLNGNPIAGETNQTYIATASGSYTVVVTQNGCPSAPSAATAVTVNPTPATPTITPGGPTTFCEPGSVTLTSSSATGNQWLLNGNPIAGETNQTYIATASGSYTVVVTQSGCSSAASAATVVTVNPTPATPTITPGGPTTFCAGGSVTLSSSSASGNQWYLDGNPIAGETNQTYIANASGSYTVVVTQSGCPSAASAATVVTVNPTPATPTITPGGPTTFCEPGSVTLTSSSATGNQWYLNGSPIASATGQQYIATASGSYTVVVTQSGCPSASSAATVVTVNPTPATPTITPSGPTTFCAGGSVTLSSSSSSGNQWYLDGNPIASATGQQYIATASGSYTVIVTQSGCPSASSAATVVTVNPTPATPTITPSGPTTFCAPGSVTLTSSSASGNQWYLDGNPIAGETNQTYIATASGSYTVVVTQSGCPSASSAATVVTVNPTPATPTITPSGPTTFCAGGSVTLTSSSATGNQWLLNGNPIASETNQTYLATASGSYTVVVTQSGCPSAASAATVVTVNPTPATPTITPGGPTTFCTPGSVTLTSSSATGNQWYLDGNPIAAATSQQYIATATGNYTVVVTTSGCPSAPSAATSVTANPTPATPTITPSGPTTFCAGGSVTLTSSSATGNQWLLNGSPIAGETNQTYIANASGSYTVIVTQSGCSSAASAPTTVTDNPIPSTPTITPGGPTTFCTGGSVTLTSSSATGNQWLLNGNPIGGATNQTYNATASGNYTVIVTQSGCSSAASAATTVTVNPIPATPTITPSGPTTFCTGGSVTLTSSSATGNQWLLNGNPIGGATNQTYNAIASGNYTVIVTQSGCSSAASAATTVTVNPIPTTPTITPSGPTTFCTGGSVTLTSSSATGNQWLLNGNPIGGATNQTYNATASGNYTVIVTQSGCSSAASAATTVTVNPVPATPTITPGGPTTFCAGGSVTLTSSSATGNQWLLNGNPIGGATNQTYIATASGNYTVIVTQSGCSSAASAATTVTVNPIPSTPTITPSGPTTFCTGGSVTLTSSSATGNQWLLNGNQIGGATNQTYIANASGNYTVIVTQSGCSSAASAATTVTVNPIPATPTITPGGPTTFCAGGSVTLTSSSATGNQWLLNGNPIGGATNQTYNATASGNYTVIVTQSGCSSAASAATTVTVNPIPATPTITPSGPTTFCAGGSVTLTSSSATGNQWLLNGNPIGSATNQTYNATASGNYTVIVTQSGCSSAASAATTVTVNPIPATPTITPSGPTTFCAGGSVTLTSSSATGNQWLLNGTPIGGATNQTYNATASGNYTVIVTQSGCSSTASAATTVTVNPIPSTPTITPGGPTTFCAGGSVTLTSSSAAGNQWLLNGNPIGGATNQTYNATASGNYTVIVTQSGCSSAASAATTVTVNPIPSTPTITPSGPTTFCTGGSVTLTSSSATGNQWLLNGTPIGGATNQTYVATLAGDYTVAVTQSSCTSAASATTTVTINPIPNATITVAASVVAGSTGNPASVANAGAGASYNWSITNGTITAGAGTANITFTAGAAGTLTLNVTVTASGCSDSKSANVTVTSAPPAVTVTSVTPGNGPTAGNQPVTISGTGFNSGATVTFGGNAATNVVVVNATTITAKTPAHAPGSVNVTVTNTNATSATLNGGYTYNGQRFDPNGDNVIDPSDIFYLVNYLFLSGPPPAGSAGMLSGDANDDGTVDPADIFYVVAYLFTGGPQPAARPSGLVTSAAGPAPLSGSIALGEPFLRNGRLVIPVSVTAAPDTEMPQAISLSLHFSGNAGEAVIHRAGAAAAVQPQFEISRRSAGTLSWLVVFNERATLSDGRSVLMAEVELAPVARAMTITIDPKLTMLSNAGGTRSATVGNGMLQLHGVTLDGAPKRDAKGTLR